MMNLKKIFVLGTVGFILICLGLFYHLNSSLNQSAALSEPAKLDYSQVETKLRTLEDAVKSHQASMKEIEVMVDGTHTPGETNANEHKTKTSGQCSAAVGLGTEAKSDITILNVYDKLKFDNPDGGAWKQGWNIQVDEARFTRTNKLKVFVVPHSHNDPGWIKTFERYFEDQTKHILDSLLRKLTQNPTMKFIWAEISYFNLWWNDLNLEKKREVQRLVGRKQLEFVTGGWVMPDESSSHYFSILSQLHEGHQWLFHHLNVIPRNGWAIDPFGMSPTNAYILQRAGLKNMVIQRTHYAMKKELSRSQNLEFTWRQNWDREGSSDILCHMMPFYSYDVPHSCGPDPKICCQFDFKRMRGVSQMSCPWNIPPVQVIARNVKERSLLLLDQYRKKAMLYKTNSLLIPLGDDFRWENDKEWDAQIQNYEAIMYYVNSDTSLNAEISFGTLEDYFASLEHEVSDGTFSPSVLSGDFFTYADRDDHYWSGYFTSRPFHKATDRALMSHLRAAHISFTLMWAEVSKLSLTKENVLDKLIVRGLLENLMKSRRTLSLFQHHDGIAGTAKDHVMVDYGAKLLEALSSSNRVMQQNLQILTKLNSKSQGLTGANSGFNLYEPSYLRDAFDVLFHLNLITIDTEFKERLVTVFNTLARKQTQLVTLHVSTYHVKVYDLDGLVIDSEILPVFGQDQTVVSRNVFELTFIADMGSLHVKNYILKYERTENVSRPEILVVNPSNEILDHSEFPIRRVQNEDIVISNEYISAQFNKHGFLESVRINGNSYPMRIGMFHYGARAKKETSGLYLFLPDGPASKIPLGKPFIRIVKGRLQSYVEVWLSQVRHRITLYNHPGYDKYSIDVKNWLDIRREQNFELMMKLQTNVKSGNEFFTDLNGFQMIRRRRYSKIPLQGNYYPLPTAAYIEDGNSRVTLLAGQPLGAASLASGELEVIMDRRLMQDDERGAGQGDTDNVETLTIFKILLEIPQCRDHDAKITAPMLSLPSHITLENLLFPFHTFIGKLESAEGQLRDISDYQISSTQPLPCDMQLIDSFPLTAFEDPLDDHTFHATSQFALILRRLGIDGQFLEGIPLPLCESEGEVQGQFKPKDIFGDLIGSNVQQMSLTFLHNKTSFSSNETIVLKPMELYAFRVSTLELSSS